MIAVTSIIRNIDKSWTFTWASTGAAYYRIVLWGQQVARVTGTTYVWNSGLSYQNFPPPLEIMPETAVALSEQYQPYLQIQWYGEASAAAYRIQQYNGSIWQTIDTVNESGGWVYTFQTTILKDETNYQYRVRAIDKYGTESTARNFTKYIVCPPQPPDPTVKITYTNPNVTVAAV